MNRLIHVLTVLLASASISPAAAPQEPAAGAEWRQLLEKAIFARSYEGSPEAAERAFARALAAAKASGDPAAEQEVLRQQSGASDPQDPRTGRIVGRLLHTVATTDVSERTKKIWSIEWTDYLLDEASAELVATCLDGAVEIGGYAISLRVEDVLDIANQLREDQRSAVLTRALASEDAFVRALAVRTCRPDDHRALLERAMTDPSQVVREAACDRLADVEDPGLDDVFLRAVDMKTALAVDHAIDHPGMLARMRAASHDSWLATAILEVEPYLENERWEAERGGDRVAVLLDWAETAGPSPRATRFLQLVHGWLEDHEEAPAYPVDLVKRTIRLALANSEHFDEGRPVDEREALGSLLRDLGGVDDLEVLAPQWVRDPDRGDRDCERLFSLCGRVGSRDLDRLTEIGAKITRDLPDGDEARRRTIERCVDYWASLGRYPWVEAEPAALDRALARIETLDAPVRDQVFERFVWGVRSSRRGDELFARMEPHYVRLVLGGPVRKSYRIDVTNLLVEHGSKFGPAAALALRGEAPTLANNQKEQYGDFLIRACAAAPERAREAVLAVIRSGYADRPVVSVGTQMTRTSWPIQTQRGFTRSGVPIPIPPPPADQIVLKPEERVTELPSLLCVLPIDQAAQAAATLLGEPDCPLAREELVETLLFARASRVALDTLVRSFDDLADVRMRARVLGVFGEMLHAPARPLIAGSLESDEPVLRYAALQAAEQILAYDRARAALSGDARDK